MNSYKINIFWTIGAEFHAGIINIVLALFSLSLLNVFVIKIGGGTSKIMSFPINWEKASMPLVQDTIH